MPATAGSFSPTTNSSPRSSTSSSADAVVPTTRCRSYTDDGVPRPLCSRGLRLDARRDRPEALPSAVDAERQLPGRFRDREDARRTFAVLVGAGQDEHEVEGKDGSTDKTEDRHPGRHEPGLVHQIADDHAVADTGHESGTPLERPLVGMHQGVALSGESRG